MRGWRSLERTADRASREIDIRSDLRNWDTQYSFMHHELVVRYAAGLITSSIAMTALRWIRPKRRKAR